jgi:hypothetical protein
MKNFSATRIVASTFGVLVGLAGIDHGIFEILQGNVAPPEIMIAAIGPAYQFWEHGRETALTIVPNFLVTGILAVIFGILVILWAGYFIERKYSAGVLLLLSITLFLVGGGFAPIFLAILASLAATRINKPLKFWRMVLPGFLRRFLGKIWLVVLITLVLVYMISIVVAIFGWPLTSFFDADTSLSYLYSLANIMLGLMGISVLAGFAHDIQQQIKKERASHG